MPRSPLIKGYTSGLVRIAYPAFHDHFVTSFDGQIFRQALLWNVKL